MAYNIHMSHVGIVTPWQTVVIFRLYRCCCCSYRCIIVDVADFIKLLRSVRDTTKCSLIADVSTVSAASNVLLVLTIRPTVAKYLYMLVRSELFRLISVMISLQNVTYTPVSC